MVGAERYFLCFLCYILVDMFTLYQCIKSCKKHHHFKCGSNRCHGNRKTPRQIYILTWEGFLTLRVCFQRLYFAHSYTGVLATKLLFFFLARCLLFFLQFFLKCWDTKKSIFWVVTTLNVLYLAYLHPEFNLK